MTPIVRDAIAALDAFRNLDAALVAKLLPGWVRYSEMSVDDITAVLDHYRTGGAR